MEVGIEVGVGIGIGVTETETVKFDHKEGFNGITFKGLSDIIGCIEDFFSEAGTKARTETVIRVFKTVGIIGILEIAGVIIGAVEIGAAGDAGSFYTRHGKIVL